MAQAPAHTRAQHLWFSNETLVLKAETTIFQVPKALLAARSSVFRDMIGFPQPSETEMELYEGHPVVNLSNTASDVDAFLTAILDSSYFMPAPEPIELDAVLGILRLAHKYDVPYLYLRALKRLSIQNGVQSVDEYVGRDHDYIDLGAGGYFFSCTKLIQALTEVGALWLLPVAYYDMCSMSQALLLRNASGHETIVLKCLATQATIRQGTAALNRFLTAPSNPSCTNYRACDFFRRAVLDQYLSEVQDGEDLHPLKAWDDDWSSFCTHCADSARVLHRETLQKFWDDLPNIFGLPPWPELNRMRDAVMKGTGSG
ncbi:hypothetical protein DFH06DRAFT_1061983 [Mycena polygramma]|nr:hypothetical protein DFH06DRAFT_1061983 [Mycena polygramma]